jgi:hypothetical protein
MPSRLNRWRWSARAAPTDKTSEIRERESAGGEFRRAFAPGDVAIDRLAHGAAGRSPLLPAVSAEAIKLKRNGGQPVRVALVGGRGTNG